MKCYVYFINGKKYCMNLCCLLEPFKMDSVLLYRCALMNCQMGNHTWTMAKSLNM